jgi:uncharacterized protein
MRRLAEFPPRPAGPAAPFRPSSKTSARDKEGTVISRLLLVGLLGLLANGSCQAAQAATAGADSAIAFRVPADVQALEAVVPGLARRVIETLPSAAREQDLMGTYQLEMVAGDYAAAETTLEALRQRYRTVGASLALLVYPTMMTAAAQEQARSGTTFESAAASAMQRIYGSLSDAAYMDAEYWSVGFGAPAKQQLETDLATLRGRTTVSLQQATSLVRDYLQYREFYVQQPLINRLLEQEDQRRFIIADDVLIKTRQGATLSAYVVRPRGMPAPQPAALFFTIYAFADPTSNWYYAKYAAAHGYVGVVAFARGKWHSPDRIRPFETEGEDAAGVIGWISRQSWSDGRVGMWGGSYSGFAQWAAIKHRPVALKTIVPYVSNLPGDGLPMYHNVFLTANYAWNFYVADNRFLDEDLYNDTSRWNSLPSRWFASGRSYRELDAVDGKPNPWRQRQLQHPSYDAFWQAMAPYGREFAGLDIPILEISGYSGSDSVSDYFLPEHEHYAPDAEHYLVIGPWNHGGSQANLKSRVLDGYPIDPVAQLDTPALTFEWFDHVFKGGPMPAILQDRINFEVMGANVWRHAPSMAKMSDRILDFYLSDTTRDGHHRLMPAAPAKPGYVPQTVDFADRTTVNDLYPAARLADKINDAGALWFVSDPVTRPLSINGQIAGTLKASINKRDMDVAVAVYEITPDGRYFEIAYYLGRASYAWDMSRRKLLTPGKIETIPFSQTGIISRQLGVGSRLLVLLTVNKNGNAQVNYGTGKDVSDESIADAGEPLQVRWYNDSVLHVPVSD